MMKSNTFWVFNKSTCNSIWPLVSLYDFKLSCYWFRA